MAQTLSSEKLLFWLDKRYNVLLNGKHGVGKTAMILQAFEAAKLRYAYFSGSTMDPYIDFVGVPIKIDTADGSYIELIRPKHVASGDIQAIFIDEFNRSHKKIRNAVMELIQFGTINGKPLSKDLRVVWAATNPDSGEDGNEYDTDRLDPAQRDRFHIHVEVPYKCDVDYFTKQYDDGIAKSAIQWWDELKPEERNKVSPRRLDYALKVWSDGGDIRDALPQSSNPSRLVSILAIGPAERKLQALFSKDEESRKFLQNENNYQYSLKTILESEKFINYFIPLLPTEKITTLYTGDPKVKKAILSNIDKNKKESPFVKPLVEIATANQNQQLSQQIRDELDKVGIIAAPSQIQVFYYKNIATDTTVLQDLLKQNATQTYNRKAVYDKLQKQVGEKLTTDQAKLVLQVCNKLNASTRKTANRDMPKIIQIGNFAILQLLRNGESMGDVEKYVNTLRKLCKDRRQASAPNVMDIARFVKAQASPAAAVKV